MLALVSRQLQTCPQVQVLPADRCAQVRNSSHVRAQHWHMAPTVHFWIVGQLAIGL